MIDDLHDQTGEEEKLMTACGTGGKRGLWDFIVASAGGGGGLVMKSNNFSWHFYGQLENSNYRLVFFFSLERNRGRLVPSLSYT